MPCNHRLFDVWPDDGVEPRLLWAVLNSSIVALVKQQFGRPAGIEGNLDTEVVDVKMMLVPDPRGANEKVAKQLVDAALRVSRRTVRRYLYEEFDLKDRRELDDAVLHLLGIDDSRERSGLLERIYAAIEEEYRTTRDRERLAQKDRARSKRKGTVTAAELAEEIWQSEGNNLSLLEFPRDFVRTRAHAQRFDLPSGRVEVGRAMLETGRHLKVGTIRVGGPSGVVYPVGSIQKCEFLQTAAECGRYGVIEMPRDDTECAKAIEEFRRYCKGLEARFAPLAEERTSDAKKQKAIAEALMRKALAWHRAAQ